MEASWRSQENSPDTIPSECRRAIEAKESLNHPTPHITPQSPSILSLFLGPILAMRGDHLDPVFEPLKFDEDSCQRIVVVVALSPIKLSGLSSPSGKSQRPMNQRHFVRCMRAHRQGKSHCRPRPPMTRDPLTSLAVAGHLHPWRREHASMKASDSSTVHLAREGYWPSPWNIAQHPATPILKATMHRFVVRIALHAACAIGHRY